jgi:hypothetical protein
MRSKLLGGGEDAQLIHDILNLRVSGMVAKDEYTRESRRFNGKTKP